jgi:cytochrome c-type biogenesis protein CcmH/NrfG
MPLIAKGWRGLVTAACLSIVAMVAYGIVGRPMMPDAPANQVRVMETVRLKAALNNHPDNLQLWLSLMEASLYAKHWGDAKTAAQGALVLDKHNQQALQGLKDSMDKIPRH